MKMKKILAMLLGLTMILSLLPSAYVWADSSEATYETDIVAYLDEDGDEVTDKSAGIITSSDKDVTWGAGWYAVTEDVNIKGSVTLAGDVNIILADGATLVVNGMIYAPNKEGGYIEPLYSVTVFGQEEGTGTLKATGGTFGRDEYYAVYVNELNVNGGVLEASVSDKTDTVWNTAVLATSMTVNKGTVNVQSGDVITEGKHGRGLVSSTAIDCGELTINGGKVNAQSGDAKDEWGDNSSYAVNVYTLTVNGGELTATADGIYAKNYLDIYAYTVNVTGGTVKSTRESYAVGGYIARLNVSGGSIKLVRTDNYYTVCEINVSEGVKLSDLLAEDYCFWCDGDFVNTDGLTKLGEYDDNNWYGTEIWVLKYGESPDELQEKDALAVVTYTQEYDGRRDDWGVQQKYYLDDPASLFYSFTNPQVENITLLRDISVTDEDIEEFVAPNELLNDLDCISVASKRLTLDLNGHSLIVEDSEIYLGISKKMLIKDSSKAKNGKLEIGGLIILDKDAMTGADKDLKANLTVESGTVNVKVSYVGGGQLTVSGGKLNHEYGIISEYAKIRLSDGEIVADMEMAGTILEVTGGKIMQGGRSAYHGIYISGGGIVISGGEIDNVLYGSGTSNMIQLSGGEFREIYAASALTLLAPGYAYFDSADDSLIKNGYTDRLKNVTVKPHSCEFTEIGAEGSRLCACGRTKLEASGSEENAVAKIVYGNEYGDEKTSWADSVFNLMDFVCSYEAETAKITLLDDVSLSDAELEDEIYSFSVFGKRVIDLNGHTLDLTVTDEESETTMRPLLFLANGADVILTDSSTDKSGVMKVGNIEVASLGSLTVNGGTLLSDGEDSNTIYGRFAVADGTADFGDNETFVSHGSLTVAGGVLKCSEIYLGTMDTVSPQSLEEDESEDEKPFDWNVKITEAIDKGDNMLVSGGEVKGSVCLFSNNSLRITGGKISKLSNEESFIMSYGGELTVTGGEIGTLIIMPGTYTKAGFTLLSGGAFNNIALYEGTKADMIGFLKSGYAYCKTQTGKPVTPDVYVDDAIDEAWCILSSVTVKNHICTYDEKGICACGRGGKPNTEAVSYLDENGAEKQVMAYKTLTGAEEKLTDGWYVAKGKVKFKNSVTVEGTDVHLILTDGSTMTVNGKIAKGEEYASLTVYGQKKNSGVLSVTGAVHLEKADGDDEDYTTYTGIYLDELTVNGGTVNALLDKANNVSDSVAIYGIHSVVINGGAVKAKGADIATASDYVCTYAVWVDGCEKNGEEGQLAINGGTVSAVGGNVTFTDLKSYIYIESCGIGVSEGTVVSGGVVTAQGGAVTATGSCEIDAYAEGIYTVGIEISGGVVNAIGGDTVVRYTGADKETGSRSAVQSNGIYSYDFELNGGALNLALGSAKATGKGMSNIANGINNLESVRINGGTLTVTGEPKNDTDYTIGIYGNGMELNGGTINIMSEGLSDDFYLFSLTLTGGTAKNGKTGALKLWCSDSIIYSGGDMKLGALTTYYLKSQREYISLTELLADGYCFYNNGEWIDSDNLVNSLLNKTVIGYEPVDVSLTVGNTENKVCFNVFELGSVLGEAYSYEVSEYNDETVSATIDDKTGVLTVSPTEGAQAGDETAVTVQINYLYDYVMYLQVNVWLTDRTIPAVTLNNSTIEKVYDGKAIDPSEIASVATVTADSETVAGEWQWQNNVPMNVSDGFVTAYFVPTDDETYAPVTVSVPVKITEKALSGKPSYEKIEESGKTLADAKLTKNSEWPKGKLIWADANGCELSPETAVEENTVYKWRFTPTSTNYASAEGCVTLYSVSTGGTSSSYHKKNDTSANKNSDGSTTTVKENKATGTVTETTKNADGSTVTVETKKDGTVTTTEKDAQGNTVETVENVNGSVTVTEQRKDGTTVTTVTDEEGETESEIKTDKETEVTIPVEDIKNVTKITVTDENGNETEITEFETTENGVKISVSGNCTVKIDREKAEASKPENKRSFKDVLGHWAEDAISYAVENGLMNGVSETEFAPNDSLTRAMLVTILYRAAGEPEVNKSIPFGDVTADMYYADAVIWAQQNGIVSGISENEFAPDVNITREQIATILYRFAQLMGYDVTQGGMQIREFEDFESISDYALDAMTWAVNVGLMKGKTETALNPKDNATRAEIATMLQRFIEANK